jgi:hypothetical protein
VRPPIVAVSCADADMANKQEQITRVNNFLINRILFAHLSLW